MASADQLSRRPNASHLNVLAAVDFGADAEALITSPSNGPGYLEYRVNGITTQCPSLAEYLLAPEGAVNPCLGCLATGFCGLR